jgi:hypothetical protein
LLSDEKVTVKLLGHPIYYPNLSRVLIIISLLNKNQNQLDSINFQPVESIFQTLIQAVNLNLSTGLFDTAFEEDHTIEFLIENRPNISVFCQFLTTLVELCHSAVFKLISEPCLINKPHADELPLFLTNIIRRYTVGEIVKLLANDDESVVSFCLELTELCLRLEFVIQSSDSSSSSSSGSESLPKQSFREKQDSLYEEHSSLYNQAASTSTSPSLTAFYGDLCKLGASPGPLFLRHFLPIVLGWDTELTIDLLVSSETATLRYFLRVTKYFVTHPDRLLAAFKTPSPLHKSTACTKFPSSSVSSKPSCTSGSYSVAQIAVWTESFSQMPSECRNNVQQEIDMEWEDIHGTLPTGQVKEEEEEEEKEEICVTEEMERTCLYLNELRRSLLSKGRSSRSLVPFNPQLLCDRFSLIHDHLSLHRLSLQQSQQTKCSKRKR